ncbi:MAG: grasp-with-spasm system SPASM domain peptide maturase [Chryseobacterium sp.]|uniref:grasp-with-spasm system SPASM domain peptide maturase n=1 Tax=Chryseobacterium sp. TaxID=1871047 RepID=UPI0025C0C9B2|nr:grasp-with-spasm system SPASM domain peptide maturase [Chryseobacterium sp.]MCJ7934507.1 grasp-with-spasm system SPASM domain peptide maturase [Chryseobacterium sp.]
MKYFNLFSSILITKGVSRVLISDLQRNVSELFSLELYELIEELKIESIDNILQNYDAQSQEIISEYIDFLLENEYGFITKNDWDHGFSQLSLKYHDSNIISDLFLEFEDIHVIYKIKCSVENLQIKHLVVYSKRNISLNEFLEIDELFKNTPLENIEIYSPYHININLDNLEVLNAKACRISNLVFYNCKINPFKIKDEFRFIVNFIKENISISSCGKVDLKYFNTNLPKVLEAINHNSCLHKKIGIDRDGHIKNCPLMEDVFGNINSTTLEEALKQTEFRKYWNLTKDSVEICKDCEFRYVCTDCRAFTERTHTNNEDLDISRPLKCGYDPYTGEWEEWSKNPLKQKALQYYSN